MIRCEVKRSKLDVNRPQDEGTFGNEELRAPWQQYHDFIDEAKTAATAGGRRALYIDLHGQVNNETDPLSLSPEDASV